MEKHEACLAPGYHCEAGLPGMSYQHHVLGSGHSSATLTVIRGKFGEEVKRRQRETGVISVLEHPSIDTVHHQALEFFPRLNASMSQSYIVLSSHPKDSVLYQFDADFARGDETVPL